jgi:hypothetical protein
LVGFSENPNPGREGTTTSKESSTLPPNATGPVSGSISLRNSTIEPGHPCVKIRGIASGFLGLDMDEVDIQSIDRGQELGETIELRLESAPVVLSLPVRDERLGVL